MTITSSDPFFNELKDWSRRKLELLQKYLDAAARILKDVHYVDGFAGRGTYGKFGEPLIPGSPLRAAQLAQECIDKKRAYSLRCINIEVDTHNFHDLQEVTATYNHLVTNIHGAFADNVDQIMKIVKEDAVICFLDPFGIDGIEWTAIQRLIHRRGTIDFWIRFDVDSLRRRFGHYHAKQAGSEKQFDILCRVYGIADRDYLYQLLNGATPEISKKLAIDLYLTKLRDEFKRARREGYADAYKIESLDGEEKYYLIYACRHRKGIILASNVVYGIEEVYQKDVEQYKATQSMQLSFLAELEPSESEVMQQKVDELKHEIWQVCKGKQLTRQEIHASLLEKWFGQIKNPHVTHALKQMSEPKDGRVLRSTGAISKDDTIFTFGT